MHKNKCAKTMIFKLKLFVGNCYYIQKGIKLQRTYVNPKGDANFIII